MGEAVVAARGGSDLLWWNPAGVAADTLHEVAIHHSTSTIGQGNALAAVLPLGGRGVLGLAVNILDLGSQFATDDQNVTTGVIRPTDVAVGVSYAIAPVSGLALGATVQRAAASIRCSGLCTSLPSESSAGYAADLGAQFRLAHVPLTLGAAARHLGIGSGDMNPGRFDVGADYRIGAIERRTQHLEVHAAGSVVTTTRLDSAAAHLGTDLVVDGRVHVRAGYIRDRDRSRGSVGVGLSSGGLVFDIARVFGGIQDNSDKGPPTYFSLRYLW